MEAPLRVPLVCTGLSRDNCSLEIVRVTSHKAHVTRGVLLAQMLHLGLTLNPKPQTLNPHQELGALKESYTH